MSERFEAVVFECLGPYPRAILKDNIFSTDISRILRFKKLNWVEQLLISTCGSLPDNKKTLILLFLFAIKREIQLSCLENIYMRLDEIRSNLVAKVSKKHESLDEVLFLGISKTYLGGKYNSQVSEKLLGICSSFVANPMFPVVNAHFVILSDFLECFQGFVIRGQCRYHKNNAFTGHIAILPKLDPMNIQYQGSLEGIYTEKQKAYTDLFNNLKALKVSILITENCQDWVKDVCMHTETTLFEVILTQSSHPFDLSNLLQSVNPQSSDIFMYFLSSGTIETLPHQSILKIFADSGHFSVVLPELLGNDYQNSFEDLMKIWRILARNPLTVNSGLNFEIAFSKEVHGTGLELAFLEYIRRFLGKLPHGDTIWREYLLGSLANEKFFVECCLGSGGKCGFKYGESKDFECFEAK